MPYKVFVDGAEGTTGLKIHTYLEKREDLQVLRIESSKRKDLQERIRMIRAADISFLCLPDAASREIAEKIPEECRVLDTSTAHRTSDEWIYGMPELSADMRDRIRTGNRVAVPGCHATGVILLTRPLLDAGIVPEDYHFCAFSVTGYSGGGKKMIAQYESGEVEKSPRQYGLEQHHKHLPEILKMTGMKNPPAFMPVVSDYYEGMHVTIPVSGDMIARHAPENLKERIRESGVKNLVGDIIKNTYADQPLAKVTESPDADGFIAADKMAGSNEIELSVLGNDENILLTALYDNLGKGASGAAIQNMNIMLGLDERTGLI